jgi:hypothetical protein
MDILGWIIFVALLIGYFTGVMWAVVLDNDILTGVNSKLPLDRQFRLIGYRGSELWDQYKILFPHGTLLTRCR